MKKTVDIFSCDVCGIQSNEPMKEYFTPVHSLNCDGSNSVQTESRVMMCEHCRNNMQYIVDKYFARIYTYGDHIQRVEVSNIVSNSKE